MKFTMTFEIDNAAFLDAGHDWREEAASAVASVLCSVQERVRPVLLTEDESPAANIRDNNGNRIGAWQIDLEDK